MKIVLSRKGFDSACGGVASPIFPDGGYVSLPIPLADVVGRTKTVPLDSDLIRTARAIGVSLGD